MWSELCWTDGDDDDDDDDGSGGSDANDDGDVVGWIHSSSLTSCWCIVRLSLLDQLCVCFLT